MTQTTTVVDEQVPGHTAQQENKRLSFSGLLQIRCQICSSWQCPRPCLVFTSPSPEPWTFSVPAPVVRKTSLFALSSIISARFALLCIIRSLASHPRPLCPGFCSRFDQKRVTADVKDSSSLNKHSCQGPGYIQDLDNLDLDTLSVTGIYEERTSV